MTLLHEFLSELGYYTKQLLLATLRLKLLSYGLISKASDVKHFYVIISS